MAFQLLFLSWHPFWGRPVTKQTLKLKGIEESIKGHRFAFGIDSETRGWLPPQDIPKLEEVSYPVQELFRRAFLQVVNRPTAMEWIDGLEHLENNLKKCEENNGHFYPNSISKCPWCRIEEESNFQVIHFDPISFDTNFNLDAVWREICSVNLPSEQIALPEKLYYELQGTEKLKAQINRYIVMKIGLCTAIFIIHFGLLFLIAKAEIGCAVVLTLVLSFITGSIIFAILDSSNLFPKALSDEKKKLQQQNKQLLEDYERLNTKQSFNIKFRELENKKNDYDNLGTFRAVRLQELEKQARERQELEFLSKFRISNASILLIGYSRTLTLRSFGIETAADLTLRKIYDVPGFGFSLAYNLMDWKKSKQNQFVFNPNQAITEADKIAVEREVYRRKVSLERELNRGKNLLKNTLKSAKLAEEQIYEQTKLNLQNLIANEYKFAPTISRLVATIGVIYLVLSTIAMIAFIVANQPEKATISNQKTNSANLLTNTTKVTPEPTQSLMLANANANTNSNVNLVESDDVILLTKKVLLKHEWENSRKQ